MATDLPTILYGVWIPGTGWLRGDQSRALMFADKAVAQEIAQRIGRRAKAYFIDQSLVDIEGHLLDAEKERTFKPWSLFRFLKNEVSKR